MKKRNNIYINAIAVVSDPDSSEKIAHVVSGRDPLLWIKVLETRSLRIHIHNFENNMINISTKTLDAELQDSCDQYNNGDSFNSVNLDTTMRIVLNKTTSGFGGIKQAVKNISEPDYSHLFRDLLLLRSHAYTRSWKENMISQALVREPITCNMRAVRDTFPVYKGLFVKYFDRLKIDHTWHDGFYMNIFEMSTVSINRCNHCDDHFWEGVSDNYEDYEDFYDVSGDSWCQSCYESDSQYCESCDHNYHTDSFCNSSDGEPVCETCWDERRESIDSYCSNPPLIFYVYNSGQKLIQVVERQDKTPFYGVELEVEEGDGDKYQVADEIRNYGGHKKYFWCKGDGSLTNGFEICSHPMTFEAWRELDLKAAIFTHRGDIKSYYTNTCGIHIHMNRSAFSDLHVLKFMTFIHEYKKMTHFIAQRRKWSEYNNYCKFEEGLVRKSQRRMAQDVRSKKRRIIEGTNVTKYCTISTGDKYVPVNIQHRDSIEVRVFKGNLREVSFRKNIEYLDALYYWTKNTPLNKLDIKEFGRYMESNKKKYPNLIEYIGEGEQDYRACFITAREIPEELHI